MATKKVNFEQALEELNDIVARLENGETTLEESLELFKNGIELTKKCNTILDSAEQKIKVIENGGDE